MWVIWNKQRNRAVMKIDGKTVWTFVSEKAAQEELDQLAVKMAQGKDPGFVDRIYKVVEEGYRGEEVCEDAACNQR